VKEIPLFTKTIILLKFSAVKLKISMAKCCSNVCGGQKLAQLVEEMWYTPDG
jgi:hypothetical protein